MMAIYVDDDGLEEGGKEKMLFNIAIESRSCGSQMYSMPSIRTTVSPCDSKLSLNARSFLRHKVPDFKPPSLLCSHTLPRLVRLFFSLSMSVSTNRCSSVC